MNLCEKNKNPCNIRSGGKKFIGEIGENKGFIIFESMRHGYRAAFKTLITYRKRELDTIQKIINVWAPPTENKTNEYIKFIENKTGIKANLKLNAKHYYWVVRAIALMEGMAKNDTDAINAAYNEIHKELIKITEK